MLRPHKHITTLKISKADVLHKPGKAQVLSDQGKPYLYMCGEEFRSMASSREPIQHHNCALPLWVQFLESIDALDRPDLKKMIMSKLMVKKL